MVRTSRVLAALLLIPLVDALFLVFVATAIGWQLTVALVVLTALLGMLFVRAEGRATMRRFQRSVAEGREPTNELIDGGLLLVAGAFLLTPGLVTDAIGVVLVVPPTRYGVRGLLKRYVIKPKLDERTDGFVSGNVYTFGFPDDGEGGPGAQNGPGGPGFGGGGGGFDGGDGDAREVDFEDVRDADGGPNENP